MVAAAGWFPGWRPGTVAQMERKDRDSSHVGEPGFLQGRVTVRRDRKPASISHWEQESLQL